MDTTQSPLTPVTSVTVAKVSFWQKIEAWFHKQEIIVETDIKAILNSSEVKSLEDGFTALAKTELGQLAAEAVTAAMEIETGKINFSAAASSLIASAKSLGKTLTDSTVTALIAAAQQKVQSLSGKITSPATPSA